MQETNKYLKLARTAREEGNTEDAKKFYDIVRTEDPENGEAKFFYPFFALYEGTNGEIAKRFQNLTNVLEPAVKLVALSAETDEEKAEVIRAMVKEYTPLTWSLNRYMNTLTVGSGQNQTRVLSSRDITAAGEAGVIGLYRLGDAIAKYFSDRPEILSLAVTPWKEGVSLQQKWYAYKYDGKKPEEYAEKIKKIEPSYEMPKKAGCISIGRK